MKVPEGTSKEWVILVGQVVSGKSRFPHAKIGKFKRIKPWPYKKSSETHRILYYRYFVSDDAYARDKAKNASEELMTDYLFGMANQIAIIRDFTVMLHNITNNISEVITTTMSDVEEGSDQLYPGDSANNKTINNWGVSEVSNYLCR